MITKQKISANDIPDNLVSLDFVGQRWFCSRTTAARYLDDAGVEPIYLGKRPKSLRRYRFSDVVRFEQSAGAKSRPLTK